MDLQKILGLSVCLATLLLRLAVDRHGAAALDIVDGVFWGFALVSAGTLSFAKWRVGRRMLLQALDVVENHLSSASVGRDDVALVQLCLHLAISVLFLSHQTVVGHTTVHHVLHLGTLDGFCIVERLQNGSQWYDWVCRAMLQPALLANGF
jgi:hypothetical protein